VHDSRLALPPPVQLTCARLGMSSSSNRCVRKQPRSVLLSSGRQCCMDWVWNWLAPAVAGRMS